MGAKTDISTITALDTTNLQDNIVFAAGVELKFLMLQKTSTATTDNISTWNAIPSGRWHLVGDGNAASSIEIINNLAALKALSSASQDKLYYLDQTPPILYSWDTQSTATDDDDTVVRLTSVAMGRMYKIYPVSSSGGSTTIVSSSPPSTVMPSGTTYIWQENTVGLYPPDSQGRYPDSVITYVSNGSIWITVSANKIVYELGYGVDPNSFGKPPNDIQETFLDTNTNTVWSATIGSSSGLSWVLL